MTQGKELTAQQQAAVAAARRVISSSLTNQANAYVQSSTPLTVQEQATQPVLEHISKSRLSNRTSAAEHSIQTKDLVLQSVKRGQDTDDKEIASTWAAQVNPESTLIRKQIQSSLDASATFGKSVVSDDTVAPLRETAAMRRALRKNLPDTTGKAWFELEAPTMTRELKRDITVLKSRNYIDPKRFYKTSKEERKAIPKYFAVGTVVETSGHRRNRIPKRSRQSSLFAEVVSDDRIRQYADRHYHSLNKERQASSRQQYNKRRKARAPAWAK